MVGYQPSKPISGADAFWLVGFLGVVGSGGSERGAGLLVPALFSACEGRAPSLLSVLVSCPALPLAPPLPLSPSLGARSQPLAAQQLQPSFLSLFSFSLSLSLFSEPALGLVS